MKVMSSLPVTVKTGHCDSSGEVGEDTDLSSLR